MKSLKKLLCLEATRMYPSHGSVILDRTEKLNWYIQHGSHTGQQIVGGTGEASGQVDL
jgi:hypothetical protein